MESIIDDLFHGRIYPAQVSFLENSEYKSAVDSQIEKLNALLGTLNDENLKLFNEYKDSVNDVITIEQQEYFKMGFEMGGRFMLETLKNEEKE